HAIKMISLYLVPSYNEDMDARAKMHNAQCLAGMAFSNALLGIVHSMAHKTGAAYSGGHIVHGCANAMYLPKVIKYNSKNEAAAKRYAEIADFIGLEPSVDALIGHINKMNKALDIPSCIKDYEGGIIDEKEFLKKLPEVAANAVSDACTGSNPRSITPKEMEKLLLCCFYDTEVDF
ncbi:MAG: iron-containing alcohol dehydrogenase, partial [Oscillospiraceae bacterium]|nr:iron-containing alcohol dehydrogenase [Oscillospiraceae bacterium]